LRSLNASGSNDDIESALPMSAAKLAWDAFMRVLAEITEANRVGAAADDIHELFHDAGELLDIIDEEIENEPTEARTAMRSAVAAMRARPDAMDRDVRPPMH
jgi:hypothetical protein